jgi:hypothetical protein
MVLIAVAAFSNSWPVFRSLVCCPQLFQTHLPASGGKLAEIGTFSVMWAINISFYATHFEKYNTGMPQISRFQQLGVLFLPWLYDVSQILMAVVFLLTAYAGVGVWHAEFAVLGFTTSLAKSLIMVSLVSGVSSIAFRCSFWHFSLFYSYRRINLESLHLLHASRADCSAYRIAHSKSCGDRSCILHTRPPPRWPFAPVLPPLSPPPPHSPSYHSFLCPSVLHLTFRRLLRWCPCCPPLPSQQSGRPFLPRTSTSLTRVFLLFFSERSSQT